LDFLIYRKFGWLHNYALLHLQDELAELQAELESLDLWEERDGDIHRLVSHRLDYGRPKAPRRDLMGKIHKKLAEYGMSTRPGKKCYRASIDFSKDESLLRMQQIQSLKRPTKRSQRNVYNLIMNTQSLVLEESEWIHQLPDLVALGYGGDHGWLNTFLEDSLNWVSRKFTKVSSSIR